MFKIFLLVMKLESLPVLPQKSVVGTYWDSVFSEHVPKHSLLQGGSNMTGTD
jgi:hypothetical protein